uniref:HDC13976 n=1 Tax=Drosophila melanogaster TaxID=7227 RepID=Q6IJY4_DROME|nr:TPA_inf: HDC13976 [Drosophila melanogaster]
MALTKVGRSKNILPVVKLSREIDVNFTVASKLTLHFLIKFWYPLELDSSARQRGWPSCDARCHRVSGFYMRYSSAPPSLPASAELERSGCSMSSQGLYLIAVAVSVDSADASALVMVVGTLKVHGNGKLFEYSRAATQDPQLPSSPAYGSAAPAPAGHLCAEDVPCQPATHSSLTCSAMAT